MVDESTSAGALPGAHDSLWLASTDADATVASLSGSTTTDVVVVGAGIAGLSTAAELADRGYHVAVLERDRIGGGVTGRSTAKVTSQHGLVYDELHETFGETRTRQYATANQEAIETVADRVDELGVAAECGFRRCPAYVYGDDRGAIEREADAQAAAGLPASFVTSVPPYEAADCGVRVENQACFDPRRYLLALATALVETAEVEIHEDTHVTAVRPGRPPHVETDGGMVTADRVVLATGFPLLDRLGLFARLVPKRSYVLAIRIDGDPPEGLYYRPDEGGRPYRSVRAQLGGEWANDPLVLVGGENHKTGQGGSTVERYRRLARWARKRFDVAEIAYRWSTQDYVSADRVPLVGPAGPGARNVLLATGFGGWGMTGGTVAGRLLAQLIDGKESPIASLYDPRRFTPTASLGQVATENADAAGQFATDWLRALVRSGAGAIDPGEGTVVRRDGRPVALSRSESGELRAVSAVCPHAYCVVDWNDGEETWDCPCHGSRFDADGRLIEGPATEDLPRRPGE